MAWREAKSLVKLLSQINAEFPNRKKDWDGTIGDEAHSERKSDHNPDGSGVVCAIDITNDPIVGRLSSEQLAEQLRKAKDPRLQYVISNRKIANMDINGGEWRPYHGSNPHDHHCHVSVRHGKIADDETPWRIPLVTLVPTPQQIIAYKPPQVMLKSGSQGNAVMDLQTRLNKVGEKLTVDSRFGPATDAAVRRFQKAQGIVVDGKVGPNTWNQLKEKSA